MQNAFIQEMENEFKKNQERFQAFKKPSKEWDDEKKHFKDFDEFDALSWGDVHRFATGKKEQFPGRKTLVQSDFEIDFHEFVPEEILNILLKGTPNTLEIDESQKQLKRRGLIYVYSPQVWLWKYFVQTALACQLPLLSLSVIFQADAYFRDREKKLHDLYCLEKGTDGNAQYRSREGDIVSDLRSGRRDLSCFWAYQPLFTTSPWQQPSPEFEDFFYEMSSRITQPGIQKPSGRREKAVDHPKNEAPAPGKKEFPTHSPSPQAGFDPSDLPEELSFISHLGIPEFISEFVDLYKNKQILEAEKYIREVCRQNQGQLRNLFLGRLLRLSCLFNFAQDLQQPEQRIIPALESLWRQIFQLQPDATMERPESIMISQWEPVLYAHLLILTLRYSQELNQKQGFQTNGKNLSEEILRRHLASVDWI